MTAQVEAHLPPSQRSSGVVLWMRHTRPRGWLGWTAIVAVVLLNEIRGFAVVAALWQAWRG